MNLRPGPLLLGGLVAFGAWTWWDGRPVPRPPGALASEEPIQQAATKEDTPFTLHDFRIVPLARYTVRARVLSRERYRWDPGAALSPVDLALGWGPMSDGRVLAKFTIEQGNRWYFWRVAGEMPIPEGEVVSHSANTHLIPADALVRRTVLDLKEGDVVDLEGWLVRVEGRDGFTWVSSLSRTDTGDGSCELLYVKEARRGPR